MTKFSIIIPTYNSANTLKTALGSIASQTHTQLEVIVQDGNSTDATVAIATKYQTKLPNLKIYQEEDTGVYDAMNKAMQKASGKWLFFMGCDDFFYDNTVLEKVATISQKSNTNVLYGNVKIIGGTGWAKDGAIYDGEFTLSKMINQNICHQAIFYNNHYIKQHIGLFNTNYFKSSDWDFNLRCWAKQPFTYMDIVVANFVAGGISSHSVDQQLINDFVANILSYFKISPFHKLINTPDFIYYSDVVTLQKNKFPITYTFKQFCRKLVKKLNVKNYGS